MFLARVIGSVVSTKKDEVMKGQKLLLLRPMLVDEAKPAQFRAGANTIVAVDSLGAGSGDLILFCQGSSARQASGMKSLPIDAAVVGLVDSVEVLGKRLV
jgi:ethanolamine utilization protein EutN